MALFVEYDPIYVYECAHPNTGTFEITLIHFDVFTDDIDGQVPQTRRQSLQQALDLGYHFRHLQVGGEIGHSAFQQVLYEHNLLCDDHGPGEPSIDVAQHNLDHGHQHCVGDVVYVHWPASGEFPAGWYKAHIVQ